MSERIEGEKTLVVPINMSEPTGSNSQEAINVEEDSSMPLETCKKRKLISEVWNDFEKKKIKGEDYAICNHCSKKLKADSKNGTTSLKNHLVRCPKKKNMDVRQQLLKASTSKINGKVQNSCGVYHFDEDVSRVELARAIIVHEYPLSIVEHFQFRKFISSLQPLFKMICRNTIKRDILNIYQSTKQTIHTYLERISSRVAITTDMWTSNQKKGYMAVTAHFIDDSWKLHSSILRFVYVPAPHNKEVISEVLMDCLLEWNIDRKISTITLDNCSTNDAMVDIMLNDFFTPNALLLDGTILHMRCAAHILNLIVKVGLDVIAEATEKIRESVHFWTATPSRVEKFEEAARQLGIVLVKKLSLDCKTRWNSTYLMLQTAIDYQAVFSRLKREKLYNSLPSNEEWAFAKEVCGKLKLFYSSTELLSGTKYPTANSYFPKVCEIKVALSKWVVDSNEIVRRIASNMLDKFNKYWSSCYIVMAIAVVLDPRMKMKIVEFYYPIIYGIKAEEEIAKVREGCYKLLHEYQNKFNVTTSSASFSTSTNGLESFDIDDQDPLSKFDLFVSSTTSNVHVKSELDHYLEEPVLPRAIDFDVLSWWKTNGIKYPTLQKIARDLLAIPVSTVASESAFSTGGRVISTHRNRLHPSTIEALMCAQSWLRNDLQEINSPGCLSIITDDVVDADC